MHIDFVNDRPMRPIWVEFRTCYGSRRSLALLGLVAVMAGIVGPFGTYDDFSPLQRQVYWAAIVLVTAPIGYLAVAAAGHCLQALRWPQAAHIVTVSAIAAIPVSGCVLFVGLWFGSSPDLTSAVKLCLQSAAIIFSVSCLFAAAEARNPGRKAPRLLSRLPGAKRARLIRLAAQDHYVEVVTDRGSTLIAMRLRDAIAEAAPEPGAQIHRSHWVALRAVCGRKTVNGSPKLTLSDGHDLPIGRSFRAGLRQAGILQ